MYDYHIHPIGAKPAQSTEWGSPSFPMNNSCGIVDGGRVGQAASMEEAAMVVKDVQFSQSGEADGGAGWPPPWAAADV